MIARLKILLPMGLLLALPAPSARAEDPAPMLLDRLVAVVNGRPVTYFDAVRTRDEPDLSSALLGLTPKPPKERTEEWALEQTLSDELVIQAAQELGVEAGETQVSAQLAELQRQNRWSDAEFVEALAQIGFPSVSAAHRAYRRTLSVGQVMRIKVGSRVSVSEKEVKEHFRRRYGDGLEDEVRLRQILVRVPLIVRPDAEWGLYQHLDAVREKIAAGELSFAEAARRYSESGEAREGGDLGWTRRGTYQFDSAAFGLKPGQVSHVTRSFLGFHIVTIDGHRRVPITTPDRLKRVITQELFEKRFDRELARWLAELHNQAVVRRLELRPLFGGGPES